MMLGLLSFCAIAAIASSKHQDGRKLSQGFPPLPAPSPPPSPRMPGHVDPTPGQCLWALGAPGGEPTFSGRMYDSYHQWFTKESYIVFAKLGKYQGLDNIQEFFRFVIEPYWHSELMTSKLDYGVQVVDGICVMRQFAATAMHLNPQFGSLDFRTTAMLKVNFLPDEVGTGITVLSIDVHYSDGFVEFLMSDQIFNTSQTRNYVCNTMQSGPCNSTWDLNGFTTTDECVEELAKLPMNHRFADVTGNTQGCRAIHAAFANINPNHCAHTSLVPQADPNGKVKCQYEQEIDSATIFSEDDLALWTTWTQSLGIETPKGYEVCDCNNLESRSWLWSLITEIVVSLAERFQFPFPQSWSGGHPGCKHVCESEGIANPFQEE